MSSMSSPNRSSSTTNASNDLVLKLLHRVDALELFIAAGVSLNIRIIYADRQAIEGHDEDYVTFEVVAMTGASWWLDPHWTRDFELESRSASAEALSFSSVQSRATTPISGVASLVRARVARMTTSEFSGLPRWSRGRRRRATRAWW